MFYYIPKCALNTVIFSGVVSLLEFDQLQWLYSLRAGRRRTKDVLVWCAACLGTLVLGALKGLCLSVVISLIIILYDVVESVFAVLGVKDGHWVNVKVYSEAAIERGVLVLRPAGPIFYANAESFQQAVEDCELAASDRGDPVRAVVLSASAVPFVDATALEVLKEIFVSLAARNILFFISGAHGQARLLMEQVLGHLLRQDDLHLSIDACIALVPQHEALSPC